MGSTHGLFLASRQYLVWINTNRNRRYDMVYVIPEMSTITFMAVVQYSNQMTLYLMILLTRPVTSTKN